MSAKNLSPWPRIRFMDDDGNPLAGGKLYTYRTGTSSNKTTYSDADGTQNANPVILDADGYADLWLDDDEPYRFRLETSSGVLVWQRDNMTSASGSVSRSVANIAALKLITGSSTATTIINVSCYATAGDGGGGQFWWNSVSTATDDGGITIQATGITTGRWIRLFDGPVNALWYGLKGDNATTNDADLLSYASLAALNARSRSLHIPAGKYIIDGPFRFDSGITVYGDGTNTWILYTTGDSPVMASRNWFSAEGGSPSGRTHIRDLQLIGSANSAYTNNHGLVLRDYYSIIDNVRVSSAGGDGIRLDHKNDAGTAVGGTLVENRVMNCTVTNANSICYHLGEASNSTLTDGFLINCISDGETGHDYGVYIGQASGWVVNGIHTYGAQAGIATITLANCFFTNVSNLYCESTGVTYGLNCTVQRGLTLNNINIRNTVSGVQAINLVMAGGFTSAEVTASNINITNTSTNTVLGWTVGANITLHLAAYSSYNSTTGAITDFNGSGTVKTLADAIIMGELRESTNSIGLKHRGQYLALAAKKNFTPSNPAVAIAVEFDITTIRSYNNMVGTVHVNSRTNYNGTRRCTYMGQVYIQAKLNGTDAWVVTLDTIVTPAGFSSNPAATISNNADGTGTLTITFTPSNTDDYGSVALLLTPGETT